jgi:hypothetical protein
MKTGSTTLQETIFPLIPEFRNNVVFNPPQLWGQLRQLLEVSSPREENEFRSLFRSSRHFISMEQLVGYNPDSWLERAESNLRLFGKQSTIVITARPTDEWLRSLYQQEVHTRLTLSPKSFFVNKSSYNDLQSNRDRGFPNHFNVDGFDLRYLYQLYSDRFESVHLVPYSQVFELNFLATIFHLTEEELTPLRRIVTSSKTHNRAYSAAAAMSLTFQREWVLEKVFGLTSRDLKKRKAQGSSVVSPGPGLNSTGVTHSASSVCAFGQTRLFAAVNGGLHWARRGSQRIRRKLTWRYLMQEVLDQILPYKPYELPGDVYRNRELARENDLFLNSVGADFKPPS